MRKLTQLKPVANKTGISMRRLQQLCQQGRIKGARRIGLCWMVPIDFTITPGRRGPASTIR